MSLVQGFLSKIFSRSAAQPLSRSAALTSIAFALLTACSGSSDPTVAADFEINGVKGTVSGQNVTIDLTSKESCSTVTSLVTGVQANGASISPDPTIARDYSQPVQYTITAPDGTKAVYMVTVKGNACGGDPTPAPTPTPLDTMPTGAVLVDWFFGDRGGGGPMQRYSNEVTPIIFPPPMNEITNPAYDSTCIYPNCVHSYWAIDTSAFDSAGRVLTYSMAIAAASPNANLADMSANLKINSSTGKITQICSSPPNTNVACYDANDNYDEFLITVTAHALGGNLPLVRSFKIKVKNEG